MSRVTLLLRVSITDSVPVEGIPVRGLTTILKFSSVVSPARARRGPVRHVHLLSGRQSERRVRVHADGKSPTPCPCPDRWPQPYASGSVRRTTWSPRAIPQAARCRTLNLVSLLLREAARLAFAQNLDLVRRASADIQRVAVGRERNADERIADRLRAEQLPVLRINQMQRARREVRSGHDGQSSAVGADHPEGDGHSLRCAAPLA